jgi:dihydroorotate dehydrogenase (fumarate)
VDVQRTRDRAPDKEPAMIDLQTRYLGLDLRSPIVASSSPATAELDDLRRLEDAGVGAVVLPSMFEEQLTRDEVLLRHDMFTSPVSQLPAGAFPLLLDAYNSGQDLYLQLVTDAKAALDIPVIASLNGVSLGGWVHYASLLEKAGADAIELNEYYVGCDPATSAVDIEDRYLQVIAAVRDTVNVPLAVKVSPYFTALSNLAAKMVDCGADGLVLFNRFYQPDVDLNSREVTSSLALSRSDDLRLPLRWIGILYGQVTSSLAATGGVHTAADVAKVLLAGGNVAMMASALLRHGPGHVTVVEAALRDWMATYDYGSVTELRGTLSRRALDDPAAYERVNYLKVLVAGSSRYGVA